MSNTRVFGYARMSTKNQNEDRQLTVLQEQGIPDEFIFVDKTSGKKFDRPEYQLLKRFMREGIPYLLSPSIALGGTNKRS